MINFNVWPSQISDGVRENIKELSDNGILSISHRSSEFTEVSKSLHNNLRELLQIPANYKIFYTSSATEVMEITLRNFVVKNSYHLVNWAFSNKFYKTAIDLWKNPEKEEIEWGRWDFKYNIPDESELICLTQNETSTWVYIPNEYIKELRKNNQDKLLVVDIVSSVGWVFPKIEDADIWFFSVQKCFWLPAWLWIMIVNEKAIEKSKEVYEKLNDIWSYHSIPNMLKKYDKYQTNETPNVFGIYLLNEQLKRFNNIWKDLLEKEIIEKSKLLDKLLDSKAFVKDNSFRSKTIYVFKIDKDLQKEIKEKLKKENIIIWNWYWKLKEETMRIANFPTSKIEDIKTLISIIEKTFLNKKNDI